MQNGKALVTDGPFAETKEHLAGYYIIECENLDEAIEWAAKIPTECQGGSRLHRNPAHARRCPQRFGIGADRQTSLPWMDDIRSAVESVFRQESGRIIASLIRISGSFDRAEEAMQESFASALASWPVKGIPDNPAAWIMTAAHRKLIDAVRREQTRREKQDSLQYRSCDWPAPPAMPSSKQPPWTFPTTGCA